MPQDWSRREVEQAVSDYLEMLANELAGQTFNKADHNRRLQDLLPDRSRGSIEFKHQNVSAVLIELGFPYIEGYKPRRNYQELLREVVSERLGEDQRLRALAAASVEKPVEAPHPVDDLLAILVPAPRPEESPRRVVKRADDRPAIKNKINYLEREARNSSLGRAGEELVLRFEHERLWRAGKKALAESIEHVSATQGDGLGYDISSFEESGRPRLVEVKTTRFGASTPFFVSRNEVAVSGEREQEYCLYRVFDFERQTRLFLLPGAIGETCELEAIQYRASVR